MYHHQSQTVHRDGRSLGDVSADQVADAVVGVVGGREGEAKLGHPDEDGADGQRADHVQVVRITSW